MPDAPKKSDFFGPLKKFGGPILVFLLILGLLVGSGGFAAGAYGFKQSNQQSQVNLGDIYRPGNASDQCIHDALIAVASDGAVAWANLRGKTAESPIDELPYFRAAAAEFRVPLALALAVGKNESGFEAKIRDSSAGAVGIMQLLPSTYKSLGYDGSNIRDPEVNVRAGTQYIAQQYHTFHNSIQLAAAAYNAGPQAVIDAGNTVPSFKDTKNYVQNVTAIFNAIQACATDKTNRGQQNSGQAAALCDPKKVPFKCDTTYAMKPGDPTRDLTKYIEKNMPARFARAGNTDATAIMQPRWIVVHTTEGDGDPSVFEAPVVSPEDFQQEQKKKGQPYPKPLTDGSKQYDSPDTTPTFLVRSDGTVLQYLPHNVVSRATGLFNNHSISIEIIGNADTGSKTTLNNASITATGQLVGWLMQQTSIDIQHVITHEDVALAGQKQGNVALKYRSDAGLANPNYQAIWQDYQPENGQYVTYGKSDPGHANMTAILKAITNPNTP